ncbi:interferon-induced 6-16 [Fusarium flagelliforme]|uniref:Interferon-induced 6-16 n=1 Tax=Fusarium flagelliforme TaxID=2675880 RepID=A0A395MBF0_9HYPO|nr:interferon-induced 6-16 [Fusarium flagelliforme]
MLASTKSFLFSAANSTFKYAKENPLAAAGFGTAGIMVAAPAVVAAPALAAAGFGVNGIAAGSAAAAAHAGFGNVAAHSSFAALQSYGMAGYGVPLVHGVIQAAGAAGAAIGVGSAISGAKADDKREEKKSFLRRWL